MLPESYQIPRQSVIYQPLAPRVTQDQIIVQNQQTLSTIQSVVCPVCLLVLTLPHWVCEGCDNAFCKPCLQDWWRKDPKSCIYKCQNTSFKMVKRSQTYQALMEILKIKCGYCLSAVSISASQSHDKFCIKKPVPCNLQGCGKSLQRQFIQQHQKNCQFRREQCRYCKEIFLVGAIQNHSERECPERLITCKNQGCDIIIKAAQFNEHQHNCQYQKIHCKWCQQSYAKKNISQHIQDCPKRELQCQWCKLNCLGAQIQQHIRICPQSKILCALCGTLVKVITLKQHREQCVFSQLIALKLSHEKLNEQNVKLKIRVHQLEQQLQDSIKNRHQATLSSFITIKQEQKKQLQHDLARLKYSLNSVKKMRTQELTEHQKRPHLSTSFCVYCNAIRKKLQDDILPLTKMLEEVTAKITQIQRIQNATRKSMIRVKQN